MTPVDKAQRLARGLVVYVVPWFRGFCKASLYSL